MQMNLPLFFDDLDAQILSDLVDASRQAQNFEPVELLEKVYSHLELARSEAATNPMIHLRLVEALTQAYSSVAMGRHSWHCSELVERIDALFRKLERFRS